MAVTSLTATAVSTDDQWAAIQPTGTPNKVPNINSDDASSAGSGIQEDDDNLFRQGYLWTSLPPEVEFILPGGFEAETTARRAGGSNNGEYRTFVRNADAGARANSADHQPGAGDSPLPRFFDTFALDSAGAVWKAPTVNAIAAGVQITTLASGVNVFFMTLNITWGAGGTQGTVDGISWLGPLVLAGLRGLNLLRLRDEELVKLDRQVFRPLWKAAGLETFPALMVRSERERILWELFRKPVFNI